MTEPSRDGGGRRGRAGEVDLGQPALPTDRPPGWRRAWRVLLVLLVGAAAVLYVAYMVGGIPGRGQGGPVEPTHPAPLVSAPPG